MPWDLTFDVGPLRERSPRFLISKNACVYGARPVDHCRRKNLFRSSSCCVQRTRSALAKPFQPPRPSLNSVYFPRTRAKSRAGLSLRISRGARGCQCIHSAGAGTLLVLFSPYFLSVSQCRRRRFVYPSIRSRSTFRRFEHPPRNSNSLISSLVRKPLLVVEPAHT